MPPVPDWVLQRVVGSKPEDWVLYREGWVNSSEELRSVEANKLNGIEAVYISGTGVTTLLPRWPL
jgi:hypothetical protein